MASEKKMAAGLLVATGVLGIALMSQHPRGDDSAILISGMHGAILIVLLVQAAALIGLLGAKGLRSLQAATFYAAGIAATVMAGVLNGFVFPSMRAYGEGEIGQDIFDLIWRINQSLAELGVIGIGIGYALWSIGLWQDGRKLVAGAGMVAGLLPALLLASNHLAMNLHGALVAYGVQLLWVIVLGAAYWRKP